MTMVYDTTDELPESIQERLSKQGQELYLEAYNEAERALQDPEQRQADVPVEEQAHLEAWETVQQSFPETVEQ